MKQYDLIVIGSGVGLTIISQGINQGLKCALIEDAKIGGTCLTRGCIPSKVLVYPADVIREVEHAKKVGLTFNPPNIDWDLIAQRMWSQIDESNEIEESLKHATNLDIYRGVGEFTGKYEMRVKLTKTGEYSEDFKAKKIVIASGARSFIPAIRGINTLDYFTSETFFGLKFPKKPWESLIIIGGGVIAAEFAHIFSAMGTKITIIEMLPRLVSTEEPEISETLEHHFQQHMTVLTNAKAIAAREEKGKKIVEIEFVKTGKRAEYSAEAILIAAGVQSNADRLKVDKCGIETDKRHYIHTNEFLETNIQNIWAIGDANGQFQFRHKANHDAEVCARNLFRKEHQPVDYSAVPWAIFTYPQIAHVGMTEQEAIAKGHKIYVAVKEYPSVAKGFAMGLEDGLFKLIVDENYSILGAHAVGPHAAMLVQPFVYLMNAGFTCAMEDSMVEDNFSKATHACPEAGSFMPIYRSMVIHPSLNEVAGWALGNLRAVNIEPHLHHH